MIKLHKPKTKAILIFETLKNNDKKIEIKTFCSTNNTKQQVYLEKLEYEMCMKYKILAIWIGFPTPPSLSQSDIRIRRYEFLSETGLTKNS